MKRLTAIFTNPAIQKKMLFTLGILLVFRIGVYISVPGVDVALIRKATTGADAGIFEMMNMLGGNALSNYSIFGLGVGPYITASIIIQLLAMDIVPFLTDLQQGGDAGRKKLAQLTRYFTIVLAFAQAIMLTMSLNTQSPIVDDPTVLGFIVIALFLTAGAMFLLCNATPASRVPAVISLRICAPVLPIAKPIRPAASTPQLPNCMRSVPVIFAED